jgi:magnesium transporter
LVVDNYFLVLDKITDQIDSIEEKVLSNPTARQLNELYSLKRDLTLMRQSVYPSREIMFELGHDNQDHSLINEKTFAYFRDVHDHMNQVLDSIDYSRDMIIGLLELHLSTQSNRMNEVMKALTLISVIFLPLNLIVGYFGMNFTDMPELQYQHAQWWVIIGMLGVSLGLILYFKFRKWL